MLWCLTQCVQLCPPLYPRETSHVAKPNSLGVLCVVLVDRSPLPRSKQRSVNTSSGKSSSSTSGSSGKSKKSISVTLLNTSSSSGSSSRPSSAKSRHSSSKSSSHSSHKPNKRLTTVGDDESDGDMSDSDMSRSSSVERRPVKRVRKTESGEKRKRGSVSEKEKLRKISPSKDAEKDKSSKKSSPPMKEKEKENESDRRASLSTSKKSASNADKSRDRDSVKEKIKTPTKSPKKSEPKSPKNVNSPINIISPPPPSSSLSSGSGISSADNKKKKPLISVVLTNLNPKKKKSSTLPKEKSSAASPAKAPLTNGKKRSRSPSPPRRPSSDERPTKLNKVRGTREFKLFLIVLYIVALFFVFLSAMIRYHETTQETVCVALALVSQCCLQIGLCSMFTYCHGCPQIYCKKRLMYSQFVLGRVCSCCQSSRMSCSCRLCFDLCKTRTKENIYHQADPIDTAVARNIVS